MVGIPRKLQCLVILPWVGLFYFENTRRMKSKTACLLNTGLSRIPRFFRELCEVNGILCTDRCWYFEVNAVATDFWVFNRISVYFWDTTMLLGDLSSDQHGSRPKCARNRSPEQQSRVSTTFTLNSALPTTFSLTKRIKSRYWIYLAQLRCFFSHIIPSKTKSRRK